MIEKTVVDIATKLISTPSISGSEKDIAYTIKETIEHMGVDKVFIDQYGNVIASLEGSIDKVIVFEGHMDHVPPGNINDWIIDPYSPRIIDGKLYGRGSVDMKGAIAAMITSINLIKGRDLSTIFYIFVPYEEIAEGVAFKYAIEDTLAIRPDLVVLGEATNLDISIGQRGRAVVYVEFYGETAHASMPEKGVNALEAISLFIEKVKKMRAKIPSHPILGKSTIVPTVLMCTPQSPPMMPDYCRLVIDRRFIIGENEDKIITEIEELAGDIVKEGFAKEAKVYIPTERAKLWTGKEVLIRHFFPAWLIEESSVIDSILRILSSNDLQPKTRVWRFSTDGVYSAGMAGITTIGFGPGDESLAHKPNEHVPVKHLVKAAIGYSKIPLIYSNCK
ncbi:MAG: YgeY family selenium metabolism-linked hydrolase [Thermoprotei archaeon]|nr:MAG: YgeY family selenium metabolism-linked hydrolase [Thermoprotei archaeon]